MSAARMGRDFSPENRLGNPTQGVALGWYGTGPLALGIRQALRAKGATSSFFRAKGALPYQPGASPQEWNHPTKQRAEGPTQRMAGYEARHHFRGITKMMPQRSPAAGFYQRSSSQGFLDYSNRRRIRETEDSSATANSSAHGVFTPRSQGKATVKETLTVQIEQLWRGTVEESSVVQTAGGTDVLGLRGIGIGRAFSPPIHLRSTYLGRCTRLVSSRAFGPREIASTGFLGRCPRLVWRWAFGPETQTAPTARFHTSLGQRPRYATHTRIEG